MLSKKEFSLNIRLPVSLPAAGGSWDNPPHMSVPRDGQVSYAHALQQLHSIAPPRVLLIDPPHDIIIMFFIQFEYNLSTIWIEVEKKSCRRLCRH